MTRALVAGLVLLAAAPVFHYERPVQLATNAAPETCVVLPVSLLPHAAPELKDLRLMAGGHEIAYQIRVSGNVAAERARPQQILNLGERDGAVSFDVEMTEPRYNRLVLHIGRSPFSVLLRITGSQHPGDSGVAFPPIPYSSDAQDDTPAQRLIPLPESSFRYLHFEVKTLALEPVTPQDIIGVDVLTEIAPSPRYLSIAAAKSPQQKAHETIYEFAVPANVPVEQLSFASDDPHAVFSRSVTVHRTHTTSGDGRDAGDRAREFPDTTEAIGVVRSASRKSPIDADWVGAIGLGELGAVPYPSTVTATIANGDDEPIALHGVRLEMRERQLCFLRKNDTDYVLRYGNPSLGAPQYDLTPIEAAAATASMSTPGEERLLLPGVAEQVLPFTERHPVLLWMALVLVVGTLGFVAVRSAVRGQGSGKRG